MARGNNQAQQGAQAGVADSAAYAGNAGNIFGDIAPQLMTQAAHPAGMAPTDLAAANTGAQQSAGGTQAAAVGSGLLRAARTRNAGGADAAMDSSARHAGEQLSQAGLSTVLKNASLKNQQQEGAESELGNLYSTSVQGGNAALGATAANVNANTQAANSSWDWAQDIMDPLVKSAGSAAGGGSFGTL